MSACAAQLAAALYDEEAIFTAGDVLIAVNPFAPCHPAPRAIANMMLADVESLPPHMQARGHTRA